MKTEAAVLFDTTKPLEVVTLETPDLKPGQVLVEVVYSGVCGTQVMEARGRKGEDRWLPHCLGHEATGIVLETGSACTKVEPGDEVVLSWIKGQGHEAGGSVYSLDGRNVNAGGVTTFQRHTVVSENRLTPVPKALGMKYSVLLGCPAPTGMGAVLNVGQVGIGSTVAIFGTGGVGLNACMAASYAGAGPVIGVDPAPGRRALAERFGCTHTVDPTAGDVIEQIKEIVPGGVDVAIEATGIPSVMLESVNATRVQGGRCVIIGNARFGETVEVSPEIFNSGRSFMGTWGGDSVPDRDYSRFAKVLASGRFPLEELLSDPYPLSATDQALIDLETAKVGRPLLDMSL